MLAVQFEISDCKLQPNQDVAEAGLMVYTYFKIGAEFCIVCHELSCLHLVKLMAADYLVSLGCW